MIITYEWRQSVSFCKRIYRLYDVTAIGAMTAGDSQPKLSMRPPSSTPRWALLSLPGMMLLVPASLNGPAGQFPWCSLSEIRHLLGASCYVGDKGKCFVAYILTRKYWLIRLIIILCHHSETWLLVVRDMSLSPLEDSDSMCFSYRLTWSVGWCPNFAFSWFRHESLSVPQVIHPAIHSFAPLASISWDFTKFPLLPFTVEARKLEKVTHAPLYNNIDEWFSTGGHFVPKMSGDIWLSRLRGMLLACRRRRPEMLLPRLQCSGRPP